MVEIVVDEMIGRGLRYTEEEGRVYRSLPSRDCYLWKDGVDEPVSGLNLVSLRQRFGALAVSCEGLGGVETLPRFRRQGLMSKLMKQVLARAESRGNVLFIADAVEGVYEKFGFVSCVIESYLMIPVRNVELASGKEETLENSRIRHFRWTDLPAMMALYNRVHSNRTGTQERRADWNRLVERQMWRPGSEVIVFERRGEIAGYAVFTEQRFGVVEYAFEVDEVTAVDVDAARSLLLELGVRSWHQRISEFKVYEPLDSAVGKAAREMGCRYMQKYPASGGMMGMILDRSGLLCDLKGELKKRVEWDEMHDLAFEDLVKGELVPDDRDLLRLLMGYISFDDLLNAGLMIGERFERIGYAWFGGLGRNAAYVHRLDRY